MTNDPNSNNHPNPAYDLVMHQADNSGEGHYPFPDVVSLREPLKVHEIEGNLPANRTIDERMDRVPEPVLAQTPAVLHYPKSREVIQLISGTDIIERNLGFNCRSIAIQNLGTNGFIWCPELNIYLTAGPTTMNIINLPSGVDNLSFVWHTAAFNASSPAAVAGQYANIWLYDDWVMPELSQGSVSILPGGVFPAPAIKSDTAEIGAVSEIGAMNQWYSGVFWVRARGDAIGGGWVQGAVANGVADSGNPLKVGGVANSSSPAAVAAGQRVNDWRSLNGAEVIAGIVGTASDNFSNTIINSIPNTFNGNPGPLWVAESDYNGLTWDRRRTPNVFKTAVIAAGTGNQNIWVPAAGKKFRLMGYHITVSNDVSRAAAGIDSLNFLDQGTFMWVAGIAYVPAAAGALAGAIIGANPVNLGNGYLSSAANNILVFNHTAANVTGSIMVTVWGTEE